MTSPTKISDDLVSIFLKMPAENIAYLKFIIESYDDLGVVRTLDVDLGEVVVLCPHAMETATRNLLESIRDELQFLMLTGAPESVSRDWLLVDMPLTK